MKINLKWTFVFSLSVLISSVCERGFAQFDANPFYLQQLRLRPEYFRNGEDAEDLKFTESILQFNFQWEEVHAAFAFGSADQNQKSIFFTPRTTNPDWTITEASVGYQTGFGEFRLGQMPIRMLFEDFQNTDFDYMPDSLLRKSNWFVRTDSGLRYFVAKFPWQAALYGHTGEDDQNLDRRYFATTYLKFQPSQGFGFITSAFVGRTGYESTKGSVAGDAGFQFDPLLSSRIRAGAIDLFYTDPSFSVLIEKGIGQIQQETQASQFSWGRADAIVALWKPLYVFGRFEMLNPNTASTQYETQKALGGLGWSIQKGLGKISVSAGDNSAFASFEINYLREREGDNQ